MEWGGVDKVKKGKELDAYGKPKQVYLDKLSDMSNEELLKECDNMIWLHVHSNPVSDYHWRSSACYEECKKRGKVNIFEKAEKHIKGGK